MVVYQSESSASQEVNLSQLSCQNNLFMPMNETNAHDAIKTGSKFTSQMKMKHFPTYQNVVLWHQKRFSLFILV